jgi:uncharacterized protein (TIGR03067 family)
MRLGLIAAAACLVTLALLAPPAARADDKEMMQGTWKVTFVAVAGQTVPDNLRKKISMKFEGDEVTLVLPNGQSETHPFTLNPKARPRAINFGERSGVGTGKRKKKTDKTQWLGIYRFKGPNELELCWGSISEPP